MHFFIQHQRQAIRVVFCIALLLSAIHMKGQTTVVGDTIDFSGQTKSIFVPAPVEVIVEDQPRQEIEQIERTMRQELEAYVMEMKSQEYISDNVVPEVDIEIIEKDDEPALKLTYSYSLLVDTLIYQTDDFNLGAYQ